MILGDQLFLAHEDKALPSLLIACLLHVIYFFCIISIHVACFSSPIQMYFRPLVQLTALVSHLNLLRCPFKMTSEPDCLPHGKAYYCYTIKHEHSEVENKMSTSPTPVTKM